MCAWRVPTSLSRPEDKPEVAKRQGGGWRAERGEELSQNLTILPQNTLQNCFATAEFHQPVFPSQGIQVKEKLWLYFYLKEKIGKERLSETWIWGQVWVKKPLKHWGGEGRWPMVDMMEDYKIMKITSPPLTWKYHILLKSNAHHFQLNFFVNRRIGVIDSIMH